MAPTTIATAGKKTFLSRLATRSIFQIKTNFPGAVLLRDHIHTPYRVFSHDITAAILVSQNNETAAMLVSQTNPLGVELFSYANALFCYNEFA